MSNRAVSATYRDVIDNVINSIRPDFDDLGIEREVLDELQRSWEAKIIATGVTDFEGATPAQPKRGKQAAASKGAKGEDTKEEVKVKSEDEEPSGSNKVARLNGAADVRGDESSRDKEASGSSSAAAIPISSLTNGASSAKDDGSSISHKRKRPSGDSDEIGSDLDDSDEDEMEGNIDADGNEDMILCLYEKVARVRNRWRCNLRDGVASIDGRDYVFSRLNAELEW